MSVQLFQCMCTLSSSRAFLLFFFWCAPICLCLFKRLFPCSFLHCAACLKPNCNVLDEPLLASGSGASVTESHGLGSGSIQVAAYSLLDPPLVVRKLKAGWKEHIPLSACTNTACLRASKTSEGEDETLLIDGGGRVKMVGSKLAGADREPSMTSQEFIEAYPRFIRLIRTHFPGPTRHALARAYEVHYRSLMDRVDFWSDFEVIMAYDVALRRRHLQVSFNPADFQEAIWNDVWSRWVASKSARISDTSFSTSRARLAPAPLTSGPATSRVEGFFPGADRDSFRNSLCFACGKVGHASRVCRATRTPWAVRNADGKWSGPDGRRFCYGFNTAKGCVKTSCDLVHVCSLCGRASHSATTCSK